MTETRLDLTDIKEWYWAGIYEPNSLNPMDDKAIRTLLRTRSIVGINAVRVNLTTDATASTDLHNVNIPYRVFVVDAIREDLENSYFEFDKPIDKLTNKETYMIMLSYMNTYFIHEYNHIKYTNSIPNFSNKKLGLYIFNIIEDMYINHISMQSQSSIFFKLFYQIQYNKNMIEEFDHLKNKVLFQNHNDDDEIVLRFFVDALLKLNYDYVVYGYDSQFEFALPVRLQNRSKLKQLLGIFLEKFNNLFTTNLFTDRVNITQAALDFIDELLPRNQQPQYDNSGESGKLDGNQDNIMGTAEKKGVPTNFTKKIDNIFEKELIEDNNSDELLKDILAGRAEHLTIKDILTVGKLKHYDIKIDADKRMLEFGKYLRFQWGVNRSKVKPYKDGDKINKKHLVNAPINGKVFSKGRENKLQLVKPQNIFVVDISGSMGSFVETVMQKMKAMSISMQNLNIRHSIWAHTTGMSNNDPIMYLVYCYNMPDFSGKTITHTDFDERINRVCYAEKMGNEDYIVIEKVTKYFEKGTKNLFMLSDGKPSPTRVNNGGVKYTQKAIMDARSKGINVYSMSLKKEVVEDNDVIYGRQYNFRAYDELLQKSLQEISEKLAQNK